MESKNRIFSIVSFAFSMTSFLVAFTAMIVAHSGIAGFSFFLFMAFLFLSLFSALFAVYTFLKK